MGAFGFFYQGSDEAPGNMGLYDQVSIIITLMVIIMLISVIITASMMFIEKAMALQWIKDNIHSFKGDGDQVRDLVII